MTIKYKGSSKGKRLNASSFQPQDNTELINNSEYKVYGILFDRDGVSFAIRSDTDFEYLNFYPAYLFSIIDNSFPGFFCLGSFESQFGNRPFISFKEWALVEEFYKKLMERDEIALAIFDKYKKLLEDFR